MSKRATPQYKTVIGFIQWPPEARTTDDGQTVRDAIINDAASGEKHKVSLFDSKFNHLPLRAGDLLVSEGKYSEWDNGQGRTYRSVTAKFAVVFPSAQAQADAPLEHHPVGARVAAGVTKTLELDLDESGAQPWDWSDAKPESNLGADDIALGLTEEDLPF